MGSALSRTKCISFRGGGQTSGGFDACTDGFGQQAGEVSK